MGLKDFNADLRAARSSTAAVTAREDVGIFNLERGDSDGQLCFDYTHRNLPGPLSIQVALHDITSYPRSPRYYLYINSGIEGSPFEHQVLRMLKRLAFSLRDRPIGAIFPILAGKLSARLNGDESSDEEAQDGTDDSDGFGDFEDDFDEAWSDHDLFDDAEPVTTAGPDLIQLTGSLATQKKDLAAAMLAGVSIGVYGECDSHYGLVSLSIPVSCWGVSSETLEAWDLIDSDHVVLLIRCCEGGYPSTADFLESEEPHTLYRFALGKCSESKPSEQSAREALREQVATDSGFSAKPYTIKQGGADFEPLYLFNSIERILKKDFQTLIKLRRVNESLSWSQALTRLDGRLDAADEEQGRHFSPESRGPRILRQHALGSVDSMSIPLVAMNCAVYLMVHSGQHCMICGRPFAPGFETMRPYVCDRFLCLDQYFSLNLGPGIEHEIINNPHAVDLLVSFFYSALLARRVRQFPLSLRLKGPGPVELADKSRLCATIQYDESLGTATLLQPLLGHQKEWMKAGTRVMLLATVLQDFAQHNDSEDDPQPLPWYERPDRYLCTVLKVFETSFTFEVTAAWPQQHGQQATTPGFPRTDIMTLSYSISQLHALSPSIDGLPAKMMVLPFNKDVSVVEIERNATLLAILCGLPPILSIRKYLLDNPGHRLASPSHFLDPTSYRLLLWIVASNRSFIVQDQPVVARGALGEPTSESISAPNRVLGMEPGWLQFRFVQGCPEKEHRFAQEVKKLSQSRDAPQDNTLFAWHGSELSNWHGIVSTGLNFDEALHGRSFGHGVYFSENFQVSRGYAQLSSRATWPNSDLQVSQAISMCEIVNKTEEFVSTTPHLVVNQVDWIQCRFLFARVTPTAKAVDPEVSFPQGRKHAGKPNDGGYVVVRGSHHPCLTDQGAIKIPKSAIPSRQRDKKKQGNGAIKPHTSGKKRSSDNQDGFEQGNDLGIDLNGILLEDGKFGAEAGESPMKRRRHSVSATDFEPGTLDWNSIPKLPDPQNPSASAKKILMQEFRAVSKAQEAIDVVERGWHIDFSKLENMFHWVVELHSFDKELLLAQDMKQKGCKSVVLELTFGSTYPMAPPFARIIRPRFLEFAQGGGGNVTQGGSICSEMLVTQGWAPTMGIEKVILQIRLQLCDLERPARLKLDGGPVSDYSVPEALDSYKRTAAAHGWSVSSDLGQIGADLSRSG